MPSRRGRAGTRRAGECDGGRVRSLPTSHEEAEVPALTHVRVRVPRDSQRVDVGDLLRTAPELATIMRYGLSPIILLFNNDMYASVRIHQERRHPGRTVATDLTNPDFATLAQAHGIRSETVIRTDEFPAAFERAASAARATIIELRTDPDRVGARTVLSELRARAASSSDR